MSLDDEAFRAKSRAREVDKDRAEFNAELSETKAGYTYRTSAAAHESRLDIRAQKARKADARLSALEALLASDPEYRALYEDTRDKVNAAGAQAEAGLEAAEVALDRANEELTETEENAARTQSGDLAFQGADGKTYDQNGQVIEGVESDSIVWPPNAPSHEEYVSKKNAVSEANAKLHAWRGYLLVVGEARERFSDPDNPLTKDELVEIQKQLEDNEPKFSSVVPPLPDAVELQSGFASGSLPKV